MQINTDNNKYPIVVGLLFLLITTIFVYSNHFHNAFHFDDSHTIENNLAIRDISNWPSFFKDGTTFSSLPSNQSYRPVVTLLNALDYYWAGAEQPEPFVFHLSIFISFVLMGIFLFFVIKYLLDTTGASRYNVWVSLFITGWFWLHTANAETINYIIARSDSFSTMLVVAAFALYLRLPALRKYYLYMIPVVVGFLTKEPAILFVPLLFLYKLFFEADLSIKSALKSISKSLAVLKEVAVPIIISLLVFLFYKTKTPETWTPGGTKRFEYVITQPYVIFHYFKNFFVPTELVVDTDWQPVDSIAHPWVAIGFAFVIALLVCAFLAARSRSYRLVTFGICWYFIALAPTSLIPFAEVLNDHRTFFPYIGLFIAVACLLRNLLMSPAFARSRTMPYLAVVAGCLVLTCNALGTHARNEVWRDEASLWKEATEKAPRNGRAWMNYGLSLMAEAKYPEAEACYQKTLELWPNYGYAFINMGILKAAINQKQEAEKYFSKALELMPGNPSTYSYYARFLNHEGRVQEAGKLIKKGLSISPQHPMLNDLAAGLNNVNTEPALKDAAYYLNKSLEAYNTGDFKGCVSYAEQALVLKPDYHLAYNNICAAYNRLGEWTKAIEAGEKGLKIDPENQLLQGNLRESYKGREHNTRLK